MGDLCWNDVGHRSAGSVPAATPFMKSRRVILRRTPTSRSCEFTMSGFFRLRNLEFCPAQSQPQWRRPDSRSRFTARLKPHPTGYSYSSLCATFGFLDRQFSALETDSAMRSIAKRFVDGTAAAAKRKRSLACEVVGGAIRVHQINRAFGSFHSIGTIRPDSDLYLSHDYSSHYGFSKPCRRYHLAGDRKS